tara:strand:- start:1081 stop:1194 length:114 start_codon:yes stop_codon:yes gene_type:complete
MCPYEPKHSGESTRLSKEVIGSLEKWELDSFLKNKNK